MYCGMRVSAPSLHRESTDSLIRYGSLTLREYIVDSGRKYFRLTHSLTKYTIALSLESFTLSNYRAIFGWICGNSIHCL